MESKFRYILFGVALTLTTLLGALVFSGGQKAQAGSQDTSILGSTENEALEQASFEKLADTAEEKLSFLSERQLLIDQWAEAVAQSPGWWHVVVRYDREDGDYGTLPNGKTIPADALGERWYLLNEAGVVESAISIMRDLDGEEVQFATFQDGTWRHFGLNSVYQGDPPALTWEQHLEAGTISSMTRRELTTDNQQSEVQFVIRHSFPPVPLDDEGGETATGGMLVETYDGKTGQILRGEKVLLLGGNEQERQILDSFEYLVLERVQGLPEDVQHLLDREINE